MKEKEAVRWISKQELCVCVCVCVCACVYVSVTESDVCVRILCMVVWDVLQIWLCALCVLFNSV